MEWSWLKDWWRLKKLRRRQKCHDGYEHSNDNDDDEENYNEYCYCDECMNGDIDLCDPTEIDSDGSVSSCSGKQVVVGVCAMAKKSQSKPMKEILTRLQEFEYIKIVVFPEEVILKDPVEKWPICDCLISFHSKGFPLEKAVNYSQLRKPYVINNLHTQYDIQDRRKVYSILESEGIEIPRYAVLDRDSPDPKHHELLESEDHVEVNGVTFNKPFVEKPVSAEDHNIYIYYPTSAGGGSQRLFRKIGSRSSVYSPESRVRKTGSFIYEDFMPTDGTDVKVYTVGPDYAHAEARKSPALDGKVERDREGKEIRYPVILSNAEKLISRKVCLAFKQTVCGFDLLRANGKSYVCDVNGFSFVKNSNKYYDDCAKILGNMILRELTPTLHIPWSVPFQLDDPPIVPTTFGKMMELRCVVAVIRHGDRTPKQKMKVEVRHPKFFEIFEKYDGYKHGHVKLKRPKQLQEILDIARYLLAEIQTKAADAEVEEKQGKLEQLKSVLEMYGHFSGINRKVQMKYQPKGRPRGSSSDDDAPKEPSLVLILKWGGELTPAGRVQAEELGRIFRCMYPGGQGRHDYSGTQGLGLLSISRLHSTFRHDLKIYASDEGRVQMTAAAFAKGLLALEGELTPILVQMVKSANTNGLLDNDCDSSKYQNMAKNRLHELMQIDRDFSQADREAINPGNSQSINQALDFVKNPVQCCLRVCALIQSLMAVIAVKRDDPKTRDAILYHGETWELMGRRWGKIEKDFSTKNKTFDISKIPDIYDCIKYDLQHNQHTLQFEQAEELYINAKYLADIVIPQEYGLTVQEKIAIGQGICTPLLKKIKSDLQRNIEEAGDESVNRLNPRYSHGVSSPGRHVRTRLYFTSESHVHSLLTVLRYGGLINTMTDEQWRRAMEYVSMVSELNYMSQIVIMLYEDPTKDPCSEERFHVELHFSPGVNCCVQKNLPPGPGFRPHSRNDSVTSKSTSGEEDSATTRIDEEDAQNEEENTQSTPQNSDAADLSARGSKGENSPSEIAPLHQFTSPKIKSSEPIPIGSCHTVSGHEAMDLAKRLSKELATQQQMQSGSLGATRSMSPDTEPRSRSYETTQSKPKADHYPRYQSLQAVNDEEDKLDEMPGALPPLHGREKKKKASVSTPLYDINSATNELPLSAISFKSNPTSPEVGESVEDEPPLYSLRPLSGSRISLMATNERPLSCMCLHRLSGRDVETPDAAEGITILRRSTLHNPVTSMVELDVGRDGLGGALVVNDTDGNGGEEEKRRANSAPARLCPCMRDAAISSAVVNDDNNLLPRILIDSPRDPPTTQHSTAENLYHELHMTNNGNNNNHNNNNNINNNNNQIPSHLIKSISDGLINTTLMAYEDSAVVDDATQHTQCVDVMRKRCNDTNAKSHHGVITNVSTSLSTTPTFNHNHASTKTQQHNSDITATTTAASSVQTSSTNTVRRQRHSIAGQMSYFKMLGFGGFSKKMASTNSLFSTAVISGSSSAPNLRDMIPSTASPSVLEGIGGVPSIRPLETLHNALSLKQLDSFLETMTVAPMFKTPASSPPKYPSTPLPTPVQTPQNSIPEKFISSFARDGIADWSGQSSMTSSLSAMSSGGPPSPNISENTFSRGYSSTDMSASINSTDELAILGATAELCQMFPTLDADLCAVSHQLTLESLPLSCTDISQGASGELTPISTGSDFDFNTNDATKGSSTDEIGIEDSDEETTVSATAELSFPTEGFLSMDNLRNFNVANEPYKRSLETYQTSVMNIKRKLSERCISEENAHATGATPKYPGRSPRIQKQISAYERESRKMSMREPQPLAPPLAQRESQSQHCISADNLTRSVVGEVVPEKEIAAKTKSCANLKIFSSNTPGALVVKEKFIAPPKRVANSFHGKTQFSQNSDLFRRTISQGVVASGDAPTNRFTTTIVPEASCYEPARSTKED
ncbi:inositol hexakisphosphate and diphosphoinositol-pentakisphosphate kinase isoform X5 [Lutzomyia longipalpis]|uniref:inositol hexakisphosphate and diphosphoinositol-pentakisphosphate kinase isoform X5 n=1 Tax=Lutzomyia longipalpis TaxID=7200 RepID=UPI00248440E7|nr:inositol hexakisphosphate and diphosphoinositol-pentakisphosphate kinase isoform X5 [Lutzomyia longipalpis]